MPSWLAVLLGKALGNKVSMEMDKYMNGAPDEESEKGTGETIVSFIGPYLGTGSIFFAINHAIEFWGFIPYVLLLAFSIYITRGANTRIVTISLISTVIALIILTPISRLLIAFGI